MRAMLFEGPGLALASREIPAPEPGPGEVLVRVRACGVCRTDLHILDGELAAPKLPLILGHQIVGEVLAAGPGSSRYTGGERVGIPWLGWSCGKCRFCRSGQENLCDAAQFTGLHRHGGFAELAVADERFAFPVPAGFADLQAAPLLCGGLIGYRSLRLCGEPEQARRIGLYGFGSAAYQVLQAAVYQGREVFAFTRPGDGEGQAFARDLGAAWAGDSDQEPPEPLDAAIIFAPVGALVPAALRAVRKGGTVVCGGIHMSDIPSFPYRILWGERMLRSVANLTRRDGEEFLALAASIPIRTEVMVYPLERAQEALQDLRAGRVRGSVVLEVN
jgi:propanol-preferring alcohol dehydrogenase